jgi:hypothetical protein
MDPLQTISSGRVRSIRLQARDATMENGRKGYETFTLKHQPETVPYPGIVIN